MHRGKQSDQQCCGLEKIEPSPSVPNVSFHTVQCITNGGTLLHVGNVRPGSDEYAPWHPDNPLIRPTGGPKRQMPLCHFRDVDSDDGEIAVLHFEDIRTS